MLQYDTKRAFAIKWYIVGSALILLFAIFSNLDVVIEVIRKGERLEPGWTTQFILKALTGDTQLFLMPILCTLPFATGFIEEYKSGIMKYVCSRTDRKRYILSKIITVMVSGGLILIIGALAVCLVFWTVFSPIENQLKEGMVVDGGIKLIFLLIGRLFFFGALGASTGMYVSICTNNRYIAWMAPFMAEYLLLIFCERYCNRCYILNPKEWITMSEKWPFGNWGSCCWMGILLTFLVWLLIKNMKERMKNA